MEIKLSFVNSWPCFLLQTAPFQRTFLTPIPCFHCQSKILLPSTYNLFLSLPLPVSFPFIPSPPYLSYSSPFYLTPSPCTPATLSFHPLSHSLTHPLSLHSSHTHTFHYTPYFSFTTPFPYTPFFPSHLLSLYPSFFHSHPFPIPLILPIPIPFPKTSLFPD